MTDVTGYTLAEALKILKSEGITNISVKLTAPPRSIDTEYKDDSRVVRIKVDMNGIVEIIVCNI